MTSRQTLDQHLVSIESFARQFYRKLDFAHDESHGERVVANALLLQAQEGGSRALVRAGAWLHQFHDNLDELRTGLNAMALQEKDVQALFEIARACRPNKISPTESLEAQIVFDADALDLVGPFGTVRELFCNFSYRKQSWDEAVRNCREVQDLFVRKLMTSAARSIAAESLKANEVFWSVYDLEARRMAGA